MYRMPQRYRVLHLLAAGLAVWPLASQAATSPEAASTASAMQRGAELAAVGNCAGCHTRQGGAPFAGGVALKTPFGTIVGSNISSDPKDGIGAWSKAAFVRAMREGIARDGTHLYPAFPYDHFTHASDQQLDDLYVYIAERAPVTGPAPANQLAFPFNQRELIEFWNALYLDAGATPAAPGPIGRGEALATSLGHCDSCHSPLNKLGAEVNDQRFSGGRVDGWYAPALNHDTPTPLRWNGAALTQYLRTGIADQHAMAGGPMREVVQSLAHANSDDVAALAAFVVNMMGSPTPAAAARAQQSLQRAAMPLADTPSGSDPQMQLGASVYRGTCASCHDHGRGESSNQALQMPLAIAAYDPDPSSLLRIIREGIDPIEGGAQRAMPAFYGSLTDQELTALLVFIRKNAADLPPWPHLDEAVKESNE